MKLLPKEPTPEMWEKAWNSIKDNEELERVRKVLSIHEIRMLLNHFCGAMYAAAPEIEDEPVAVIATRACGVGRFIDDFPALHGLPERTELFAHPSPRIAELESEVARLRAALAEWHAAAKEISEMAIGRLK